MAGWRGSFFGSLGLDDLAGWLFGWLEKVFFVWFAWLKRPDRLAVGLAGDVFFSVRLA